MGKTVCINCGSTIPSGVDECPECGKDPDLREGRSASEGKEESQRDKDNYGSEEEEIDISKAMETLDMIDEKTYEVKDGDSDSIIDNIRKLALKEVKEERDVSDKRETEIESEEEKDGTDYECPLCGAKVEGDAEECPGCGAIFEE